MRLKDKNIIITGTNRGIGKAMLEEFAKNGANVWAHARKETPEFVELINRISKENNVHICPVYFDLTDYETMKIVIKNLIKSKTQIDVLVNSVGVAHGGLFQMTSIQKIKEVFEMNLFVHMEITQLVLKAMSKRKSGCIINMGSISGLDLKAGNSAYGVSKAAIMAWTKTLAAECGPNGIRVNAIAPGLTDTDMAKLMEAQAGVLMVKSSALGRLALPEEMAKVAVFLASEDASFLNGQVIRVDGGAL